MSSRNPPPWERGGRDKQPPSSIPAKRSAGAQPHDRASKRSNNAAEEAWVADEDRFVLQQAKKKAALRVKGGRARPIDWLAVTLRFIDPTKSVHDDEVEDHELDVQDPEGVLDALDAAALVELEQELEHYLALETHRANREYWSALKTVCKDRRRKLRASGDTRTPSAVAADIDKLLAPKTYDQLDTLEGQVKRKLDSDEPIDYDYWEQLLRSLRIAKARAKLRRVSHDIVQERLHTLRKQQADAAVALQQKLAATLALSSSSPTAVDYDATLDPQPALKLRADDKGLVQVDEHKFLADIATERAKVQKLGYVPSHRAASAADQVALDNAPASHGPATVSASRFAPVDKDEGDSQATMALYEREVARGVDEGEEVFAAEAQLSTTARPQWAATYKPRKPRYFNRVQMGYEWNKYNQTHYDHDNPPPKVVQGYKFNIFYPDLVDKAKAPTYKIERENGRRRGESFAPAGEDDTCLIRFIAGPPYEDIAFRIVDKEWDYSGKRERGFKSSFDKGILQLHFQFKKIYYRK